MRTSFFTGQETATRSADANGQPARRVPIHGIYNSYYRIRGLLVPISEAPAVEE